MVLVTPVTSKILLYSDRQSKIPIYGVKSRARAIMAGNNYQYPHLEFVSDTAAFIEDEIIYTSGDGDMFPDDIPVGIVKIDDDNGFYVIPFVNIAKTNLVRVLNKEN